MRESRLDPGSLASSEDYLWSLRDTLVSDEERDFRREEYEDVEVEEDGVTILASFVPDEVIYNVNDYSTRQLDGCLLFGDVSGFTDLSEKYSATGIGGSSRLTQVLNSYIGAMVQEILSRNGDIFKFSGDAFIALWKITDGLSIPDAIHHALDCALMIQKNLGVYRTDVGVTIRVKLAIAFGEMYFSLLGDAENSHYLISGESLWDIKLAEEKTSAGQIVCTMDAWKYLNPNEYLAEEMDDKRHVKVYGIGPSWKSLSQTHLTRFINMKKALEKIESNVTEEMISFESLNQNSINVDEEYALRPSVNYASKNKMTSELNRFILAPVMRAVNLNESLEFLTEVRHVAVVFINIVVKPLISPIEIIKLADVMYKLACSLVKDMNGCVNKVNNFDKDLLVLIIFGLRGFKSELESQTALKCAHICQQEIMKIPNVMSVSIGVTTGTTYCGVLGHPLRKEYTVISLTVNKAARLMMAYPKKVTCDKETFLQSKLDAKYFNLQSLKDLKGIGNPGPVYQFVQLKSEHSFCNVVRHFPLLSRDEEVRLYKRYVSNVLMSEEKTQGNAPVHNMLLYQGTARQGKTRLLEELVFACPSQFPVNSFALNQDDYEIPYVAIKILLLRPLALTEESSIGQRKRKIDERLKPLGVKEAYCFLNEVFNVDFPFTNLYKTSSPDGRAVIVRKILKQLFLAVFVSPWVIFVDNVEHIDEFSWDLLDILIDLNLVFIVATVTFGLALSPRAKEVLRTAKVKRIRLRDIDRWYRIGFVCQVLSVQGISPEIEIIINTHPEGGNPGWLQNYALTLVHSQCLKVEMTKRKRAIETGLVLAPLYMIFRMSEEDMLIYKQLLEDQKHSKKKDLQTYSKRWRIYIDSCGDNVSKMKEVFEATYKSESKVVVCVIKENSSIKDIRPEQNINEIFMQIFDALTSHEQLVLKCSSVLGETFQRQMLTYVMPSTTPRSTCLAVKKLFEDRLIVCGRGIFANELISIDMKHRTMDPSKEEMVICKCVDLPMHESCLNLPKYASCGYMRFTSAKIRTATYSLLTDNQKKEFHTKAIRYLEKKTRRCESCGAENFETEEEEKLSIAGMKKKRASGFFRGKSTSSDEMHPATYRSSSDYGMNEKLDRRTRRESSRNDIEFGRSQSFSITRQTFDTSRITSTIGLNILKQLNTNQHFLTRTFSNTDFTGCTCALILTTTYSQLIRHSMGASSFESVLQFIVKYAYSCLETENYLEACKILREGLEMLHGPIKSTFRMNWEVSINKAKLYSLLGLSLLNLEHWEECYESLNKALQLFGFPYPNYSIARGLKTSNLNTRMLIYLYVYPQIYKRTVEDVEGKFYTDMSECLAHFCKYFICMEKWKEAKFTALWSFELAIRSYSNYKNIVIAYANLINVFLHFGARKISNDLQSYALYFCHLKKNIKNATDLKAITELYILIFVQRTMRAEMDTAINIGYTTWRIAMSTHSYIIMNKLLPLLFQLLLFKVQLTECVNILQEMDSIVTEKIDMKIWYNSSCLIFQLECGASMKHYNEIEQFCQNPFNFPNNDEKYRMFVVMWLWCLRNRKYDAAMYWQEFIWDIAIEKNVSLLNLFTAIYFFEGLLLYLSWKLDKRAFDASYEAIERVDKLVGVLKPQAETNKIILPRFYHLRGYFEIIKRANKFPIAMGFLQKAKMYAEKYELSLEQSWIEHTKTVWRNGFSESEMNAWCYHCDVDNEYDYHEIEITGRLVHFALQPPVYM